MSFEVAGRVLRARTGVGMGAKMTLLGLAEHAHPDGTEARPAIATLARYAECDERTVRRHIRKLEDAGLIETDTPREARRKRGKPVEFRIVLPALDQRSDILSYPPSGRMSEGVGQDARGGSDILPYEPVLEPVPNQEQTSDMFDHWYRIYPRHEGRGRARKEFDHALKRAPFGEILEGAVAYRDWRKRDPDFTAHPATWLHQDRWTDELGADTRPADPVAATDWEARRREEDSRIAKLIEEEDGAA